jgi:hypothetical protein
MIECFALISVLGSNVVTLPLNQTRHGISALTSQHNIMSVGKNYSEAETFDIRMLFQPGRIWLKQNPM